MNDNGYLEMIRDAQAGDDRQQAKLADLARQRISVYLYRLTLDEDLTEDLVQETMLHMVKALPSLNIDRSAGFWAWLYRSAYGKLQHYHRSQGNKKIMQQALSNSDKLEQEVAQDTIDTLQGLVEEEMVKAALTAMTSLNWRYRSILTLRCLEERSYAEIAELMQCSRLQARSLFFQARGSLRKQLGRRGLKWNYALGALSLFAATTARKMNVASAATSVSACSMKLGLTGTAIGLLALPTVKMVALATSVVIVVVSGFLMTNDTQTESLAYPSGVVAFVDPDGNGLMASLPNGHLPTPTQISACLTNPTPEKTSAIVLEAEHWIEVSFDGPILDGPGPDIVITERCQHGESIEVLLTDGNTQSLSLGTFHVPNTGLHEQATEFPIDINDLDLEFTPHNVRLITLDPGPVEHYYALAGFDLVSIRARLTTSSSQ
ncbi:RNA polymerase sigma factor [Planctomycetota bacterium]